MSSAMNKETADDPTSGGARSLSATKLHVPSPRSLLGTLVFKEVHDLVLTLRFTVGTLIAVILAVLAAYIGSLDYNARLDSYQTKLKLTRDSVAETRVYSFLRPTIYRPPEPLSILHHGLEGRLGTDFQVSVDTENTEARGENRGNEYLSIFSEVDLTVIVAVILGLLALLFTFDAVCGEREGGMLKLMMSYPLSRSQLLLGKYLGAWVALMLPATLAYLLSLLVVGFVANVHFGPPEIARLGLILIFYALYLSLMLLVGLVISSFVQRSSLALVFSAFAWFFFVTVVPNLATMIPDFVGDRARVYQTAMDGLKQVEKEQRAAADAVKDPREGFNFYYAINNNGGGFTAYECTLGDRKYYDQLREFFAQRIRMSLKFAARRAEVWRQYIRYQEHQAAIARGLSFLSPSAAFQNAMGFASGTSQADHSHFISLATQCRNTFLDYLQRKGVFASLRWFTPDPPDQDRSWTTVLLGRTADELTASGAKPDDVANKMIRDQTTWAKIGELEKTWQASADRFLSLGDLPAFTYTRLATGAALVGAGPEIAYLLGLNLILFLVAFVRFVHYDVR
jgi:ABC-type transport system involved in multi-copper enzyme maturation permease subunit